MQRNPKVLEALQAMSLKPVKKSEDNPDDYLSWGVTLLDLSTYGQPGRGLKKGHIYRVWGSTGSGKTFLCRSILAEAARNPAFDGYELIYDDVEYGALMDTEKFFGKRLVNRLVPPTRDKDTREPIYSRYTSDFYSTLRDKLESGKKLIWVEDSLDSLAPDAESKMTDGKAKANSQELRKLLNPLQESGSILILVSQARIDMKSLWGGETTAGGTAPEFYSTASVMLKKIKTLKVKYKGKLYPTGILVKAQMKKNRLSGKDRVIFFPFSPDVGIDDVGSQLEFLYACGHWKRLKNMNIPELNYQGGSKGLIRHIEKEGLEDALQQITFRVWNEIEAACRTERKPRYS